jgi:hypothetical protein
VTEAQRDYLKTKIDEVIALELADGRRMLAQILVVYDEGETPDLFCLEVEPTPSGYVLKGTTGESILLSDVASVQPAPAIEGEPR